MSAAAGRDRPVKSNEKLMNVEHRTFNIEHRIMYSACRELLCRTVYFKKTERSDIHHSSFDNRHSSFHLLYPGQHQLADHIAGFDFAMGFAQIFRC
jgi:hypothetical protein